MFASKVKRSIAAGVAAVAISIGVYAVGNSSSTHGAAATASVPSPTTIAPPAQAPQNWTPGSGTIITGADADKATAAAVAQYPDGTVNRVLQLSDGSYAVHRINTPSPHHIFVSKD